MTSSSGVGIEKIRKETVYAPESVKEALRDRFARSKQRAVDPWLERREPRHPTQFIPLQPLDQVLA
jgi:hypothetical protein